MPMSNNKSKELLSAMMKIKKMAHNGFRKTNISTREFVFLKTLNSLKRQYLDGSKGVKASDLSKHLMITKPAISKLINILEDKGLVERITDKSDRRVVYINITKKGEEMLAQETEEFERFTNRVIEKMGEEDTNEMIRLFEKMYNSILEIEKEDE